MPFICLLVRSQFRSIIPVKWQEYLPTELASAFLSINQDVTGQQEGGRTIIIPKWPHVHPSLHVLPIRISR